MKYLVTVNEYEDDKAPDGSQSFGMPVRTMLSAVTDDIATAQRLVIALTNNPTENQQ